jgi:hypothetical protein
MNCLEKYVQERFRGQIYDTTPTTCVLRKVWKTVRTVHVPDVIRTGHLVNESHKHRHLCQPYSFLAPFIILPILFPIFSNIALFLHFHLPCPPAVSSIFPWPAQSCTYGDKPFYFHALGAFWSILNQPVPDPESYKRFLESCLGGADPFIPHPQHWLLWR